MKKPNFDAMMHLLKGTLDALPIEVPPGVAHQLGGHQVVFTIPDFATVTRAEGTAGKGFNLDPPATAPGPPVLSITLAAALLFLSRCGIPGGKKAQARWEECIRESLVLKDAPLPIEALTALATVQAEQKAPAWEPGEPTKTRTPSKRTGAKEVKIEIQRLPKAALRG